MNRKGLTPVISSLILASAVIVIGGGIWSYANGASVLIAEGYVTDTTELLHTLTERFVVEHVSYDSVGNTISVWVFNYGDQAINVTSHIYITQYGQTNDPIGNFREDTTKETVIHKGHSVEIELSLSDTVEERDRVSIKIYSQRGNEAHELYYIK